MKIAEFSKWKEEMHILSITCKYLYNICYISVDNLGYELLLWGNKSLKCLIRLIHLCLFYF